MKNTFSMPRDLSLLSISENILNKIEPVTANLLEHGTFSTKPKARPPPPYKYTSLSTATSIRLLRLEPGKGSEVIQCSLREVDLDSNPPFTALSYSWRKDRSIYSTITHFGLSFQAFEHWLFRKSVKSALLLRRDATYEELMAKSSNLFQDFLRLPNEEEFESLRTILCDGQMIGIQQNLYEALLSLRSRSKGPEEYWIDAVCTDQDNLQERSSQVQMMNRIYNGATRVVIWLGNLPALLDPTETKSSSSGAGAAAAEKPKSAKAEAKPIDGGAYGDKSWHGIEELPDDWESTILPTQFMARRWWRRLWVIQEYCLAQEVVFLLDDRELRMDTIKAAMTIAQDLEKDLRISYIPDFLPQWLRISKSVTEMLQIREHFKCGKRWTLPEWLQVLKGRKATDAKDAVFAGLALIDSSQLGIDKNLQSSGDEPSLLNSITSLSLERPSWRLWDDLHVDYEAGLSEVLLNLAACLITNLGWESLFYHTLLLREPPNQSSPSFPLHQQPSWIPDPSAWTSSAIEPFFLQKNTGTPLPLPAVASAEDFAPKISRDGSTLFLSAAKFDTISQCSSSNLHAYFRVGVGVTMQLLEFIATFVPKTYAPTGTSGIEAFSNIWYSSYRMTASKDKKLDNAALLAKFCRFIYKSVLIEQTIDKKRRQEATAAWEKIRTAHPDAPWPDENAIANKKVKTAMSVKQTGQSPLNSFSESGRYALFMTQNGYMGLGPSFLQKSDQVFLMVEGKTPYIFRHINDVLSAREPVVVQELADARKRTVDARFKDLRTLSGIYRKMEERNTQKLEDELEDIRRKKGVSDGWQLLGEVYVEGVMNGEVAGQITPSIQRYNFV